MLLFRPLTTEEIAQRRELLRQKQLNKITTDEESMNQNTTETNVIKPVELESNDNLDDNAFLAFARVFSGRLKRGQKIFVLSPRHDPTLFIGKVR